jgi:hypothetical protein
MIPKNENLKNFAILACKEFKHIPTDGSAFPYIGSLLEDDTIETVLRRVVENSRLQGVQHGKLLKIREIKNALNIDIDE